MEDDQKALIIAVAIVMFLSFAVSLLLNWP